MPACATLAGTMSASALALVLVAAVLHATWNLWLKRAQADPASLSWLTAAIGAVAYAPAALLLHGDTLDGLSAAVWWSVLASGVLHVAYFFALQHGYRVGDLSVVYPVARGVGPMLSALVAIVWLGEPATVLSLLGLALIVAGTFTIAGGWAMVGRLWRARGRGAGARVSASAASGRAASPVPATAVPMPGADPAATALDRVRAGLVWGAITGVLIACYTVTDGRAVRVLGAAPLLFYWMSDAARAVLLTPAALVRRDRLKDTLRHSWRPVVGIALISPLGYILVLQAMTMAPVSHVAPAREVSMLIAAVLGARLLSEGELARRLAGAVLIVGGVVCLALA